MEARQGQHSRRVYPVVQETWARVRVLLQRTQQLVYGCLELHREELPKAKEIQPNSSETHE